MAPIEPFHNIHVWPTWTEEAIKRRMDVQWNLSLGTSPSLYFITSTDQRDTSIQGKETLFWVPKPGFNLHSGDTIALKEWLTTILIE